MAGAHVEFQMIQITATVNFLNSEKVYLESELRRSAALSKINVLCFKLYTNS